jgi:hypothetical protein
MRLSHAIAARSALRPGRGLRYRALGSESLFRVLGATGPTVEVEVVSAPGLVPGARLHLSLAGARAGEPVKLAANPQARLRSHLLGCFTIAGAAGSR